jgi:hypothetical protein
MKHSHLLLLAALALLSSTAAQASSIVFSTFQPNALSCECYPGAGRPLGYGSVYGNRFTVGPETSFTLDEVELAVGLISGAVDGLNVLLYSDVNDRHSDVTSGPDLLLESLRVEDQLPAFGTDAPPITVDSIAHPTLEAGHSYWLLVATTSIETEAGWYLNNASVSGLVGFSQDTSSLCCVRTDLEETFQILGSPTQTLPEPSTDVMTASALVLLGMGIFRRAKKNS